MTQPVILAVFAGRRANLALQFRWVTKVLELNPDVTYECWSMARDPADKKWLASLPSSRRAVMRYEFANHVKQPGYRRVWRHYAADRSYRDTLFVKTDDDVVFADPARFHLLIEAARDHPDTIISADVINNGACNTLHPDLAGCALNTYTDNGCADTAHTWFQTHWRDTITQPVTLVPAPFFLSINMIAMTWPTLRTMANLLHTPCPPTIAGYTHGRVLYGDEGACNTLPIRILSGVMAAHLDFEPQQATSEQYDRWRAGYADILTELDT